MYLGIKNLRSENRRVHNLIKNNLDRFQSLDEINNVNDPSKTRVLLHFSLNKPPFKAPVNSAFKFLEIKRIFNDYMMDMDMPFGSALKKGLEAMAGIDYPFSRIDAIKLKYQSIFLKDSNMTYYQHANMVFDGRLMASLTKSALSYNQANEPVLAVIKDMLDECVIELSESVSQLDQIYGNDKSREELEADYLGMIKKSQLLVAKIVAVGVLFANLVPLSPGSVKSYRFNDPLTPHLMDEFSDSVTRAKVLMEDLSPALCGEFSDKEGYSVDEVKLKQNKILTIDFVKERLINNLFSIEHLIPDIVSNDVYRKIEEKLLCETNHHLHSDDLDII